MKRRNDKGSVFAEFAISVPLLVSMLLFIMEFGNFIYISNSVQVLAQSSARYASLYPSASESTLLSNAGANLTFSDTTPIMLSVSPLPGASRNVGDTLTVTITYSYTPIINPFAIITPGSSWAPSISKQAKTRIQISK